jgi:hypothetical protein
VQGADAKTTDGLTAFDMAKFNDAVKQCEEASK